MKEQKQHITSIFDPLCDKYNNTFRMTTKNFADAKCDVIKTIETAEEKAKHEATLQAYREMKAKASRVKSWDQLMFLVWNEKLARDSMKTIKL